MSMFDDLRVDYPLPDGFHPQGRVFQTKDTPLQDLQIYVLTAAGRLVHEASGAEVPFEGDLTFYTGNVAASAHWGVITDDGAPAWWAEYVARFEGGVLRALAGAWRLEEGQHPHLTRQEWHVQQRAWDAEQGRRQERG